MVMFDCFRVFYFDQRLPAYHKTRAFVHIPLYAVFIPTKPFVGHDAACFVHNLGVLQRIASILSLHYFCHVLLGYVARMFVDPQLVTNNALSNSESFLLPAFVV